MSWQKDPKKHEDEDSCLDTDLLAAAAIGLIAAVGVGLYCFFKDIKNDTQQRVCTYCRSIVSASEKSLVLPRRLPSTLLRSSPSAIQFAVRRKRKTKTSANDVWSAKCLIIWPSWWFCHVANTPTTKNVSKVRANVLPALKPLPDHLDMTSRTAKLFLDFHQRIFFRSLSLFLQSRVSVPRGKSFFAPTFLLDENKIVSTNYDQNHPKSLI